jgi:hypothetical protein
MDSLQAGIRIGQAIAELKGGKVRHSDRCRVELDPEGYAPCNCGATSTNAAIERAIRILETGSK